MLDFSRLTHHMHGMWRTVRGAVVRGWVLAALCAKHTCITQGTVPAMPQVVVVVVVLVSSLLQEHLC